MRIILFGGAFDPPHSGHLQVISSLLENDLADEVWLVPVGVHDFQKQISLASFRVQMLELLIAELPQNLQEKTKIEKCELSRPGVNHTIDTLNQLSKQYTQHQFSWVIGSDNLAKFHLWDRYELILSQYHVYVYPRFKFLLNPIYQGMTPLTQMKQVEVSSTEIKQYLRDGGIKPQLLPKSILDFINQEHLYFE